MKSNPGQIKETFTQHHIKWSRLFDAKINDETLNLPLYLGVYQIKKRRGFENAQKQFNNRLNKLILLLDTITIKVPIVQKSITEIKAFNVRNNQLIDFKSIEFKNDCRISLVKRLRSIIRKLETEEFESILEPNKIKIIKKFYYQLSPFNYSHPYLTHLFYATNEEVKILLVDDAKRKALRYINGIFELTAYIARAERPRRNNKRALSYRYLLIEENPGLDNNESIIFGGGRFDTSAGGGVLESWALDNNGSWKYKETFNHWRS
jgi:hypothetical protein